jgi:uncharacterized protein with PIN domain
MNLSNKDKKDIMDVELKYEDNTQFLHCEHCLSAYLKEREANDGESDLSPRDAMNYESASQVFTYPDGTTANIFTVWCKTCGRRVWDSRHLTHLF